MGEVTAGEAIRSFATERSYRDETVARWVALDPLDAASLLEIAADLRLGENQLRDLWLWAEEIAARDGSSLVAVFAEPGVRSALRKRAGRNDRVKGLRAALRRLRFPQLAAHEQQLAALVEALQLPGTVRVHWPEFLEGDSLHVELDVRSPAALAAQARALADAAARPEFAEIFALLDGDVAS